MDLIVGKGGRSAILTMCDRSRNYLLMRRLPHGKSPEGVAVEAPLPTFLGTAADQTKRKKPIGGGVYFMLHRQLNLQNVDIGEGNHYFWCAVIFCYSTLYFYYTYAPL